MVSIPRRVVLGVAAAIWSLSWTDQVKMYLDERSSVEEDGDEPKQYPRSKVFEHCYGSATAYHTGPHCTELKLGIYPHQPKPVSIEIDTGIITSGVAMDEAEASKLATELLAAFDEVNEWRDAVEYTDSFDNMSGK